MKPRYSYIISLTAEESKAVQELKDRGIKIVEIFRKGIEVLKKTK